MIDSLEFIDLLRYYTDVFDIFTFSLLGDVQNITVRSFRNMSIGLYSRFPNLILNFVHTNSWGNIAFDWLWDKESFISLFPKIYNFDGEKDTIITIMERYSDNYKFKYSLR